MPDLLPAEHYSKVIHDYLSSATAIAAGAPALADLQRRHLGSTVLVSQPSLLVDATADPDGTDTFVTINLKLILTAQIGVETGQTTAAAAQTLLQSLRALLADSDTARSAWATWIALQTDDYRSGWTLEGIWPGTSESEINSDKSLLTLTAPFQVTGYWQS